MRAGEESHTSLKHFVGVVENRIDPRTLGRVQVRIYGIHTDDKTQIPTEDLPWATVVTPITSAGISGVGRSPTGVVEGSWVFGVLVDEREYQTPVILGTLVGAPTDEADIQTGFYDPEGAYPLDEADVSILGESSTTRLARGLDYMDHANSEAKSDGKELLGTVESALAPKVQNLPDKEDYLYERTKWVEPWPRYGGQGEVPRAESTPSEYPFNHVTHTEGGHVTEIDDTPGGERLHVYHSKGTFIEVQPDGSKVTKVVGSDYEITIGDKDVYVKGSVNITIDGDVRQLIHGNKIEEIDGDLLQTIRGDHVKVVQGNEVKEILSDKNTQINGNDAARVSGNRDEIIVKNFTETVNGDHVQTINGDIGQTVTVTADENKLIFGNSAVAIGGQADYGSGLNLNLATAAKGTFEATGNMLIKTDGNQVVTIAGTQGITATGHSTFNNNLTITGTTHSVGDVSTAAGNAPTLATHKHKQTGGTTADGDGPTLTKDTSVADQGAPE
jgi:hypothetical protein